MEVIGAVSLWDQSTALWGDLVARFGLRREGLVVLD